MAESDPVDPAAIAQALESQPTSASWVAAADFFASHSKWHAASMALRRAVFFVVNPSPALAERELLRLRLLLVHDLLRAGEVDAAARQLEGLPDTSTAARLLQAELELARGDPVAALRRLDEAPPATVPDPLTPEQLYCSAVPLPAMAIDRLLRARARLAGGDPAAALAETNADADEAPAFAELQLLRADALRILHRFDEAGAVLQRLRTSAMAPAPGCPATRLDRLLLAEGNVAADRGRGADAEEAYRQGLLEARRKEAGLREALKAVPAGSPLLDLVKPELRDEAAVAPEIRNNLGQLLLDRAGGESKEARQLTLVEAQTELIAAAKSPGYRTPHYAYLGVADAELARGDAAAALDSAARALAIEPAYEDGLDFVAALTRNGDADVAADAGSLLLAAASLNVPKRYTGDEYGSVLERLLPRLATGKSAPALRYVAAHDLFAGDLAAARSHVQQAATQFPAEAWPMALRTQLEVESGLPKQARTSYAAFLAAISANPPRSGPEAATLRAAAATYVLAAVARGNAQEVQEAEQLLATLTPSRRDTLAELSFPWSSAPFPTQNLPQHVHEVITVTAGTSISQSAATTQQLELGALPTGRRSFATMAEATAASSGLAVSGSSPLEPQYVIDGAPYSDDLSHADWRYVQPALVAQATRTLAGPPAEQRDSGVRIIARQGGDAFKGELQGDWLPRGLRAPAAQVSVPTARREQTAERRLHLSAGGRVVPELLSLYLYADDDRESGSPTADLSADASQRHDLHLFGRLTADQRKLSEDLSFVHHREGADGVVDDIAGSALGDASATGRRQAQVGSWTTLHAASFHSQWVSDVVALMIGDFTTLTPNTAAGNTSQSRDLSHGLYAVGGTGFIDDGHSLRRKTLAWTGAYVLNSGTLEQNVKGGLSYEGERDHRRDRLSGGEMIDRFVTGITYQNRRYWWVGDDTQAAPVVDEAFRGAVTSAFLQDQLRLRRLTVNAGVRSDRQSIHFPGGQALVTAVLEPRLGVTYDPIGDGHSRISAAFSRVANLLSPDDQVAFGSTRRYVSQDFRGRMAYGRLRQADAIDPHLKGGAEDELTIGGAHESDSYYLQLTAVKRRLQQVVEDYFCTDRLERCIGNPAEGNMTRLRTLAGGSAPSPRARAESTWIEATAGTRRSPTSPLDWELGYRWMRRRGNVEQPDLGSTRTLTTDPYARTAFDFAELVPPNGPLSRDRRHNVNGWISRRWSADEKHSLVISTAAFWQSGEPRAPFAYTDLYGRFAMYEAPRGAAGHSPAAYDLDLNALYELPIRGARLQIGGGVENLLNRQTELIADQRAVIRLFGQPTASPQFLQPMTRVPPRTGRLFVRLLF